VTAEYQKPELNPSDVIMVAKSKNGPWMPAWVTWVGERAVNALAIRREGGFRFYETCYHVDDPWVASRPELLKEGAVYKLAPQTEWLKKIVPLLERLDGIVSDLIERICALEEHVTKGDAPKRGPGRPKKIETHAVETSST